MSRLKPRLLFEGVTRRFPGGAGVFDVSFEVAPGEVVCLLGPSGCGKSTTLRLAAGIEQADRGRVKIDDRIMQGPHEFVPPERRGVGLMFQDFALFPHLSVLGNVMFGLDRLPRKDRVKTAELALDQVGMLGLANAYPHVLSGGEQQRVALARAMAPGPNLLLMDEPFSGLDERLRDEIRERTLRVLQRAGASALIVTHDPREAMGIADRIVLLRTGRVVQDAVPDVIYSQPVDEAAALFFGEHVRFRTRVADGAASTPAGQVAVNMPEGAEVDVLVRPEAVIAPLPRGVAAEIVKVKRVGADWRLDLRLQAPGGPTHALSARLTQPPIPQVGSTVAIALDPGRTLILPVRHGQNP